MGADGMIVDVCDAVVSYTIVMALRARKAPAPITQEAQERYNHLLSILDPTVKEVSDDEEAKLVTVLRALLEAVTEIDAIHHADLVTYIFRMSLWNYHDDARDALLELITRLATLADKFLDGCLHMLVNNYIPPREPLHYIKQRNYAMHRKLYAAFLDISHAVPMAPRKMIDVISRCIPKSNDSRSRMVAFVECMLHLRRGELGDVLSHNNILMTQLMDLLSELDVCINPNFLHKEDQAGISFMEGICKDDQRHLFDMEDVDKTTEEVAEKLDNLMVAVFEHLKCCAEEGRLLKEFHMLLEIFPRSLMTVHNSNFTQFVIFYACSLDPLKCGTAFAIHLRDFFCSGLENSKSRMIAVSYLGSYLSRAKFLSSSDVTTILKSLVDWCYEYCQSRGSYVVIRNSAAHQIFYAGCQAIMYILCYRMRSIMDVPNLKHELHRMPLGFIFSHPLDPLKVCLDRIVEEFLSQAKAGRLFTFLDMSSYEKAFKSRKASGKDTQKPPYTYFPFDPYLLNASDSYIRPAYEFWPAAQTTCSNSYIDEEFEFDGVDAPPEVEYVNVGSLEDHYDLRFHLGDYLEYSLNKMSISPNPALPLPVRGNSPMPARIRHSTSPL